ncbi:hypothetical protein KIW84_053503 [Lathyrus oleraceus]|uniref:Retrovirus-related Pol polyprotein from transposon TNT 1-94-like beta-barrel domain-containing protein n=1 Tax=Pisum sativum TaxID=3888 RepID=A0A9D4WTC6_PEA|nr:hypothetical protein KIW84_053503 [Pisum sativum]
MPIIKKKWIPKTNVTGLIAHIPLRISAKEEWYFDSGCSRHMTGNQDLLNDLHHHTISHVTFGDGAKCEIMGTGKLECCGVPKLDKVLLVKGLTANLISISQLCDQGLNVNFTKTECLIFNKNNEVIMKGIKSKDNCYIWSSQMDYPLKHWMSTDALKSDEKQVCGKFQTKMSHQKLREEKVMMAQTTEKTDQISGHKTSHKCRIARKTGGKRKKQQSRHRALFIPKEGKETLEVNLGKNMVSRPKRMGSGVSYAKGRHQSRSSLDWGDDTCSLGYRILCIRIFSDERRIRAFVARLTRTQTKQDKGKRGARRPIAGLTSASEPKHTHTGTQMPLDGLTSASKHTTTQQVDRESGTQPITVKQTQKKRKGARRDQLNLLPTYFIWYEDQGDTRLAQEARVSIATRARERGGLDRNEGERKERSQSHRGERKELVLVVSQTRQDIASRAYVSHLNMRIRVAVVRPAGKKDSIATRARERIATRAKASKD